MADRSRRPVCSPLRIDAAVEALIGQLQGAHLAAPPPRRRAPITAERVISAQGTFMVARQKIRVGKQRAHVVVQVTVADGVIQVFHEGTLVSTIARIGDKQVTRRRYNEDRRQTG